MGKEFHENKMKAFKDWVGGGADVDFDLWSQDPDDWKDLRQFIPSLVIASAGGIVPFQAEGLLFGLNFYYRERHGWASLSLAHTQEECYGPNVLYSAGEEVEEFRGGLGWLDSLFNLIPHLEEVEFLYSFPHDELIFEKDHGEGEVHPHPEGGMKSWVSVRGKTQEEAWAKATRFERHPYFDGLGWSEDFQRRIHEAKMATLRNEPREVDERIFPETPPVFEVQIPELWKREDGRIITPWAATAA